MTHLTLPLLSLLLVSPAPDPLRENVTRIASPGLPGTVCVLSDNAFVVADAPGKNQTRLPVIAATQTPRGGKAVLFGHDAYLTPAALKEADTARLLQNLLAWAAPAKDKPEIAVVDLPDLAADLKSRGHNALPLTAAAWRAQATDHPITILPPSIPRDQADLAHLQKSLDAGHALFLANTGWGWLQTHPGRALADHPANQLLAPLGLAIGDGTIEKDGPSILISETPPPTLNAATALQALLDAPPPTPELLRAKNPTLAQASETLTAAVRVLPPGAPILKRLHQIADTRKDLPLPSPAAPLRQANALARVLLVLQLRDLDPLPPDQIKPHPAAKLFPGEVPPTAPRVTEKLTINLATPRWHSTGLYAAPGELLTITLPESAVKQSLKLRIGPHTDKTYHLASWHRAPEISRAFNLDHPTTRAANPFGGLIYIDVPNNLTGTLEVTLANAVPAPLFVLNKTTPQQWRDEIRNRPAPWAELATDKLILTTTSEAVRTLDDPTALMQHWDAVMDASASLAAWPLARKSPERIVADADISAGYMHSGYPIMTGLDVTRTMTDLPKLRTADAGWGFYHEVGHNHQSPDWTFAGTTEVTVNLFTMHTLETVCNLPKEQSTKRALIDNAPRIKKYLAAPDFEAWKSDPFLALAMYAQLRNEFGWEPFTKVFAEYRALPAGAHPRTDADRRDQWMTRMSQATGKNLAPFFKAWGVPTTDPANRSVAHLPPWMPAGMQN